MAADGGLADLGGAAGEGGGGAGGMGAGRRAGALAAVLAAGGLALAAPAAAAEAAAASGGAGGGAARQLDRGFRASVELDSRGESFRVLLEKNLSAAEAAGGWVGFGVADQTSGHMPGPDIVTLHFDGGGGAPSLVDRHVPWAAHPFGLSDLFPVADAHDDWFLESYEFAEPRGGAEGDSSEPVAAFSAVLSRALATGDPFDNDVGAEWSSLLAVWGSGATPGAEVGYHGARRGATTLPLGWEAAAAALPADAEGSTPGVLNTHCVFDTRRAAAPVAFGPTTKDEMCMDFLFYNPR